MNARMPVDFFVSGHSVVGQYMAKAFLLLLAEKGTRDCKGESNRWNHSAPLSWRSSLSHQTAS